MKYTEFENIMSTSRMVRYLTACNNDTKGAMTLYRKNLQLSQELFTIISCFEIAIRNAIDRHYISTHGNNWLSQAASNSGMFDNQRCRLTSDNINEALQKLNPNYSHNKLVAELGFGFWRYMFCPSSISFSGSIITSNFSS